LSPAKPPHSVGSLNGSLWSVMVGKVYGHLYPSDYQQHIAKFEAFAAEN
jgi:hypothetical protein